MSSPKTRSADQTSQKCRDYVKHRGSEQAARRDWADLSSAVGFYFRDEANKPNIRLEMPPMAIPRIDGDTLRGAKTGS
jgi:hypothetical protein